MENGRRLGLRVTLLAADGSVLGDSSRDTETLGTMQNHLDRPEIRAAATPAAARHAAGRPPRGPSTSTSPRGWTATVRSRFVRIALPATASRRCRTGTDWTLASLAMGTLLVLSAVAYVVVVRVSRPIEAMCAAAERAAGGDLDIEVPYDAGDEVGRLAASVNRVKRALTGKIHEMRERAPPAPVGAGWDEGRTAPRRPRPQDPPGQRRLPADLRPGLRPRRPPRSRR